MSRRSQQAAESSVNESRAASLANYSPDHRRILITSLINVSSVVYSLKYMPTNGRAPLSFTATWSPQEV
jgi:hypothetical protein